MFYLNASLSTTAQTMSMKNSAMDTLAAAHAFPFYLIITRASDSFKEIVRVVAPVSSTDGTIMRAQQGSQALAFLAGDTVEFLNVPVKSDIREALLGSPALGTTTYMHAAMALTGAPQAGVTMTTQPDVARQLSITGNAAGIVGTATWHSVDMLGNAQTEDVTLNGTATVFTTKAHYGPVTIDLPVQTHGGTDTVAMGVGPALGLPFILPRNTVFMAFLNNVREATAPVVVFGTTVSASMITLNSALNGTAVYVYAVVPQ